VTSPFTLLVLKIVANFDLAAILSTILEFCCENKILIYSANHCHTTPEVEIQDGGRLKRKYLYFSLWRIWQRDFKS